MFDCGAARIVSSVIHLLFVEPGLASADNFVCCGVVDGVRGLCVEVSAETVERELCAGY